MKTFLYWKLIEQTCSFPLCTILIELLLIFMFCSQLGMVRFNTKLQNRLGELVQLPFNSVFPSCFDNWLTFRHEATCNIVSLPIPQQVNKANKKSHTCCYSLTALNFLSVCQCHCCWQKSIWKWSYLTLHCQNNTTSTHGTETVSDRLNTF